MWRFCIPFLFYNRYCRRNCFFKYICGTVDISFAPRFLKRLMNIVHYTYITTVLLRKLFIVVLEFSDGAIGLG